MGYVAVWGLSSLWQLAWHQGVPAQKGFGGFGILQVKRVQRAQRVSFGTLPMLRFFGIWRVSRKPEGYRVEVGLQGEERCVRDPKSSEIKVSNPASQTLNRHLSLLPGRLPSNSCRRSSRAGPLSSSSPQNGFCNIHVLGPTGLFGRVPVNSIDEAMANRVLDRLA